MVAIGTLVRESPYNFDTKLALQLCVYIIMCKNINAC